MLHIARRTNRLGRVLDAAVIRMHRAVLRCKMSHAMAVAFCCMPADDADISSWSGVCLGPRAAGRWVVCTCSAGAEGSSGWRPSSCHTTCRNQQCPGKVRQAGLHHQ